MTKRGSMSTFSSELDLYNNSTMEARFNQLVDIAHHDDRGLSNEERVALILGREHAEAYLSRTLSTKERVEQAGLLPVLVGHHPYNRYQKFPESSFEDLELFLGDTTKSATIISKPGARLPYDTGGGGGIDETVRISYPAAAIGIDARHSLSFKKSQENRRADYVSWYGDRFTYSHITAGRVLPVIQEGDRDGTIEGQKPIDWSIVERLILRTEANIAEAAPVLVGEEITSHIQSPRLWHTKGHGPLLQNALRHLLACAIYVRHCSEGDIAADMNRGWHHNTILMMNDRQRTTHSTGLLTKISDGQYVPINEEDRTHWGYPAHNQDAFVVANEFIVKSLASEIGPDTARREVEDALELISG